MLIGPITWQPCLEKNNFEIPNTRKISRQQRLAIALGHGLLGDHTAKLGAVLADGGQLQISFRHSNGSAGVWALVGA